MKKGPTPKDVRERLLSKVRQSETGCWVWTAAVGSSGYGAFSRSRTHMESAHRAAWKAFRGPIPGSLFVLHTCDNKLCINPDHLYLGDVKQNAADAWARGQCRVRGQKLTREIADRIRTMIRSHKVWV